MNMGTFEPNLELLDLVRNLVLTRNAAVESVNAPFQSCSSSFGNFQTPQGTFQMQKCQRSNISPTSASSSNPKQITPINSSPGRRIRPMSAPIKPPDIQNMTIFPPIEAETLNQSEKDYTLGFPELRTKSSRTKSQLDNSTIKHSSTTDSCFAATNEGKLKKLENKFKGKGDDFGVENETILNQIEEPSKIAIKRITLDPGKKRQSPRSAELFVEITLTVQAEIDKLAADYSAILDKNLCQNVLEELTLLLQIISSSQQQTSASQIVVQNKISEQLTTVAQQVYFVIKVLSLQLNSSLLSVDPTIIQILVEKYPHRIPKPARKLFQSWIETEVCKRKASLTEPSRKPSEFHHCVTFRSETDGRSSFPSQTEFHGFCKQRDLFYSIKNIWTERVNSGKSVEFPASPSTKKTFKVFKTENSYREVDPVCAKVKALFKINSSWFNLSHFASLFTSQYVIDSMEESRCHQTVEQDELMKLLQTSNPDRFAKLNARMSSISQVETKQSDKDCFAFQQYFLNIAASPAFNQHLIDRILFEISQIENSLDCAGSEVISEGEEEYFVKKCILLAKLLGYIFFLPYREETNSTNYRLRNASLEKETVLTRHLELRKNHQPPLELKMMLINAAKRCRLTLTLPWVVEFLGASDYISLQLPAYQEVLIVLCSLYHDLLSTEVTKITLSNKNFLRFWCGKFFSSDIFPVTLLYDRSITFEEIVAKHFTSTFPLTATNENSNDKNEDDFIFDVKKDLGERLTRFYFSSNFNQMKYMLHVGLQQQLSIQNGTDNIRHIKPIPARSSPLKPSKGSSETELQKQLESSFFDLNSPSVKRTVDFISERIASNYVKLLRKMMPEQRKNLALKRIFLEDAGTNCRTIMLQGVKALIDEQCELSVKILVGESSLSAAALEVCNKITNRQTSDKISHWVYSHIKAEMFPVIELPDVPKAKKSEIPVDTKKEKEEPLKFSVMILLNRCVKKLYQRKPVSESHIDDILNSTVLGKVDKSFKILLDFGIALITFAPSILNRDRQIKLINLWKSQWSAGGCNLICQRNIQIIQQGNQNLDASQSWSRLEEVILRLIEQQLLSFETVEQECFGLLREDLSPENSKNVSQLLRKLVSASPSGSASESREVVDWISWYCSEQNGEF